MVEGLPLMIPFRLLSLQSSFTIRLFSFYYTLSTIFVEMLMPPNVVQSCTTARNSNL